MACPVTASFLYSLQHFHPLNMGRFRDDVFDSVSDAQGTLGECRLQATVEHPTSEVVRKRAQVAIFASLSDLAEVVDWVSWPTDSPEALLTAAREAGEEATDRHFVARIKSKRGAVTTHALWRKQVAAVAIPHFIEEIEGLLDGNFSQVGHSAARLLKELRLPTLRALSFTRKLLEVTA